MKMTKLTFTLLLLTFSLNLQAQEGVTKRKPQPIYKAPNGKAFPANWGRPPLRQTRDLRPLPGGYGRGSGTLAGWIQGNLDKDANKNKPAIKPGIGKKAYPKVCPPPALLRLQIQIFKYLEGSHPSIPRVLFLFMSLLSLSASKLFFVLEVLVIPVVVFPDGSVVARQNFRSGFPA